MTHPSTRAARQLVAGSVGLLVVGGLAIWWVGNLRSLDAASRRAEESRAEADLRGFEAELRGLEDQVAAEDPSGASAAAGGRKAEDPVARAARVVSLDHLRSLVATYERATDDAARDRILDEFTAAHSLYVERTGDLRFLRFLRNLVVEGRTSQQRRCAIIALHGVSLPEVVDFFEEQMTSEHPEVRFYATEALPWVTGPQTGRAQGLLVGALDHEDPAVRRISAACLGVVVGDPRHAEDVLRRLAVEQDPGVIRALLRSVQHLLEDAGEAFWEERLGEVLGRVSAAQADRIRAEMR